MLTTPPFLLGLTLLFWGWQVNQLWISVPLAVILEGSRVWKARWEFSQPDLDRIWNLCMVLWIGSLVIAFSSGDGATAAAGLFRESTPAKRLDALNKGARSALLIFQWLPISLFPIVAAQAFHQKESIPVDTFSPWLRRRRGLALIHPSRGAGTLNPSYPYFGACLLAASTTNAQSAVFFVGITVLVTWVLGTSRPRGFHAAAWMTSLALAIGIGFLLQSAVVQLQQWLQRLDSAILAHFVGHGFEANETRTRIGAIGRLKLSGRIVMELSHPTAQPPSLLREASFNVFRAPQWGATRGGLNNLIPEGDLSTWKIGSTTEPAQDVTLRLRLPGGAGLLAIPLGTAQLAELGAFLVRTNRFATVQVNSGPSFLSFHAEFNPAAPLDAPPDDDDVDVPPAEQPALKQIVEELHLASQSAAQQIETLQKFFWDRYQYSTWLTASHRATSERTAIAAFLLKTRTGHCEYFATATALLLRQAHTPARYATGYSVQEKKGERWVIRERHAHAWCLAWVNGRWQEVDTTPPAWNVVESAHAPFWEPLTDLWTEGVYAFSEWWWGRSDLKRYLIWLIIPLALILVFQIIVNKRWRRTRPEAAPGPDLSSLPGHDSEFYAIERWFQRQGFGREPGESMAAWLGRILEHMPEGTAELRPVLQLHNRLRFDPQGLADADRCTLQEGATGWLRRQASAQERRSAASDRASRA